MKVELTEEEILAIRCGINAIVHTKCFENQTYVCGFKSGNPKKINFEDAACALVDLLERAGVE